MTAAIDLFAGAGGLSLGASRSGLDVRAHVENDKHACATLAANPETRNGVVRADVAELSGEDLLAASGLSHGEEFVMLGGPPCQPFSKASYWTDPGNEARYREAREAGLAASKPEPIRRAKADGRRDMVGHYLRLLDETGATGFLVENVPNILAPRNRGTFDELVSAAEELGYHVTWFKANAAEHGVPQTRERIFVLGSRVRKPVAPGKTHFLPKESPELFDPRTPAPTAREALAPAAGEEHFEPEEVVEGRWAEALREVPPGWNYKWLTAWNNHPDPLFVAEKRFWNFLLKLHPDKPSWTLAASPGPWVGPFHWEGRRLRTREMALLQGFPMDFEFTGPRRERVRQIGNAVPPPLAEAVTRSLRAAVSRENRSPTHVARSD